MKKKYLKPSVEYINFYSNEEIAEVEGGFGGAGTSQGGGEVGGDHWGEE